MAQSEDNHQELCVASTALGLILYGPPGRKYLISYITGVPESIERLTFVIYEVITPIHQEETLEHRRQQVERKQFIRVVLKYFCGVHRPSLP